MAPGSNNRVKKRRVFYIPGFDPFPPRRYRELYRTEGADQAKISGYDLTIAADPNSPGYGWHVTGKFDGQLVVTDYHVLVWSDIVQQGMAKSVVGTYVQLVRTSWIYLSSGALYRLAHLRAGPVVAALYPIVVLLLQLVFAFVVGSVAAGLVGWVAGDVIGFLIGVAAFAVCLTLFQKYDGRIFAYYLMHDYAFSAGDWGRNPVVLDERIAAFAAEINSAHDAGTDEVLVVGHSSGAQLGVHILAKLLRNRPQGTQTPPISFLTLGQSIPMISFLPKATSLRRDLRDLAQSDQLTWVDVTAPGDGCSFALCDPVAVSGVAPRDKKWPLVFSAAFSNSLSAEKLNTLKRRYFRLHFQYICAFDRPRNYDYFQITAGPMTLADRYRGRLPSKSRIEAAQSGYQTVAE